MRGILFEQRPAESPVQLRTTMGQWINIVYGSGHHVSKSLWQHWKILSVPYPYLALHAVSLKPDEQSF